MILSKLLHKLYACKRPRVRRVVRFVAGKLEGGQMISPTLRKIFADYHQIEIGLYSYGSCFNPHAIARFTKIGRYCSFADGVRVFNGNHPVEFKSTHPYFYNPAFGYVETELIPRNRLTIGNDVWFGYNSVVLPGVESIGDGAVIGAGAIVTKNIPDFAVVVGNPARVVRYRFPEETQKEIISSQWWKKSMEELQRDLPEFTHNVGIQQ
jgi:acetyltransferase-like isoleucine patch superfamily enzyme